MTGRSDLSHCPSVDGSWTIVAVHETRESWEQFRDNILMPRLKEGVKGGFTTNPAETAFEVHNLQSLPILAKMAEAA